MPLYKAIQLAKKSAKKIQIDFNNNSFPVRVDNIAKELGLEIKDDIDFGGDDISGLVKRKGMLGKPVIAISKDQGEQRKRFTIAHELGHFILHANKLLHIDKNIEYIYYRDGDSCDATKVKEIQANQFAAELLMPEEEMLKDIEDYNSKEQKDYSKFVISLTKKYNVSFESMNIRLGKFMH